MVRRTSTLRACMRLARARSGSSATRCQRIGRSDFETFSTFSGRWSKGTWIVGDSRFWIFDLLPPSAVLMPPAPQSNGFITMDLVQCTARSVTVVGGGANPPGSPGFRARRLQPLLDERAVAQVRIHPSQRRPLARPCAHTDCRALSTLALVQAVAGLLCGSLFGPLLGAAAAAVAARCPCPRRCCPQPPTD